MTALIFVCLILKMFKTNLPLKYLSDKQLILNLKGFVVKNKWI